MVFIVSDSAIVSHSPGEGNSLINKRNLGLNMSGTEKCGTLAIVIFKALQTYLPKDENF